MHSAGDFKATFAAQASQLDSQQRALFVLATQRNKLGQFRREKKKSVTVGGAVDRGRRDCVGRDARGFLVGERACVRNVLVFALRSCSCGAVNNWAGIVGERESARHRTKRIWGSQGRQARHFSQTAQHPGEATRTER